MPIYDPRRPSRFPNGPVPRPPTPRPSREGPLQPRQLPLEAPRPIAPDHEGGTDSQVGDRRGPGAGYDQEPEQEEDEGGVA